MAAAAIPALISAAPAIIEGAMQAKDIISKYAPTAKKVVGMLFKGHSKSPSNLLEKIQSVTPENTTQALADAQALMNISKQAYSTVKKARKSPQPQLSPEQINQLLMLAKQGASRAATSSRVRKRIPKSYHNILEQMK